MIAPSVSIRSRSLWAIVGLMALIILPALPSSPLTIVAAGRGQPATKRSAPASDRTVDLPAAPPSLGQIITPPHRTSRFGGFMDISSDGWGDSRNAYAWSMAWFQGKLYVGTSRNNLCNASIVAKSPWARRVTACPVNGFNVDSRAEIWCYTPETGKWQMVYRSPMVTILITGFALSIPRDVGYRSMAVYTDRNGETALYIGSTAGGSLALILRTVDGLHFQAVGTPGLGVQADSIRALTPYSGRLFVAPIGSSATYYEGPNRDEVFATDDPVNGRFTAVSKTGFGDPGNGQIYAMAVYNGILYVGASNNNGFQVWRTTAQGKLPYTWTAVIINGAYRGAQSPTPATMFVFHGKLYVGSANETIGINNKLAQAAEIIAINPDDSFDLVMGDARDTPEGHKTPLSGYGAGFNNKYNAYLWRIDSYDGWLYAGTYDYSTFNLGQTPILARRTAGFDLYRSHDGVHWVAVDTRGFGNPYNYGVRTMLDTPIGFFIGTANPFAGAPDHLGGAEIWEIPNQDRSHHPRGVALSLSACPMAHCSPTISGNEATSIPLNVASPAWQVHNTSVGFRLGLGCSVGTTILVCDGTNPVTSDADHNNGYVRTYDFSGHLLWDSRRLVGSDVVVGAPLLDKQDNSYMTDEDWIFSFTRDGVLRWQTPNPARGGIVSLNMTASGYLVGQSGLGSPNGLILVINPITGVVVGRLQLADTVEGHPGWWGTRKTDAVVGNRLYSATEFVPADSSVVLPVTYGRLYAIDIDGNGQPHMVWYVPYYGPTGGSPDAVPGRNTTVYVDGTGYASGAAPAGSGQPTHLFLLAIQDAGSHGSLLWHDDLTQMFSIPYFQGATAGIQTAPIHDPRGGIWFWAEQDPRVIRLNERTGTGIDTLTIPVLTGDSGAYPEATMEIATNGGHPVMLIGVLGSVGHNNGVAAIDLTTDTLLWDAPLGTGLTGAPYGQFPLAPSPDGGAYLFAPVYDGTIYTFKIS